MKVALKRRIIYTVMSSYLSGERLWSLMWRWQDKHSESSRYEFNQFLNECRDFSEINQHRIVILGALIRLSMNDKDVGLKDDPIEQMLAFQSLGSSAVTTTLTSAATSATTDSTLASTNNTQSNEDTREVIAPVATNTSLFERNPKTSKGIPILNTMMTQIAEKLLHDLLPYQANEIKLHARSAIHRKRLPIALSTMLTGENQAIQPSNHPFELQQAQQFINLLYNGCCDTLGPIEADRILSESIHEVFDQYRRNDVHRKLISELVGR